MSAEDIEYMDDYKEFPTKESALDWLDNYLSLDERNNLIRALEQGPCEDCISRAEVMENYNGVETPVGYRKVVDMEVIKNMQSVYPKAKTGHWIDQYNDGDWHCSKCGAIVEKDEQINHNWYFCYHCGARMVKPQAKKE